MKHGLDRAGAALAPFVRLACLGSGRLGWPISYRAERVGRDGRRVRHAEVPNDAAMSEGELTTLVIDPETGTGGVGTEGVDRRTRLGGIYAPHTSGRATAALRRLDGGE